jgi:5'-nucleotidase
MHFLLTNDDGVHYPGLLALKQALEPLAKITVIAPSRNYSAAGHRKTMHKPLRIDSTHLADGSLAWACSGAPSDSVAMALLGFIKEPVDAVIAGINPNANLGEDVTYSGTVTAAFEAVLFGVPGIAISTEAGRPPNFEAAAQAARDLVPRLLQAGLGPRALFSLNVPQHVKGVRVTRQGKRLYLDELVVRHDPRGRPYYWIGGEMPAGETTEEGTDVWAMAQGYISITPLQLDLTAHTIREQLAHRLDMPHAP